MPRSVRLLVGTTKGAFIYHSDCDRRNWCITGPHLPGWEVYSLLGDSRHGSRVLAGTNHFVYGPTIRVSEDLGESWRQIEHGPAYSPESGFHLKRIWQIVPGAPSEPDTLYAGVEEAGLFVSRDGGATWSEVAGLTAHPTRPGWMPGNGGLCLHTILVDPTDPLRLWVGISAVGVLRTDDGGATWKLCNDDLPALPTGSPETDVARCVHKMVADPANPSTLYMQYHWGVLRSADGGDSWEHIEKGLPSTFGFPIGAARNGDLFVIPLESDENRLVKDGLLRVYRSTDGGAMWHAVGKGLPDAPYYVGVLRDAMAVDALDPAGIYFGTTMGSVFASVDGGETWERLPGQLPRITTVKAWTPEE